MTGHNAAPMDANVAVAKLPEGGNLGLKLLHVAWLSIALGLAIETLLILVALGTGTEQGSRPFVADVVQKVSWSFLVCLGLAVGEAAAEATMATVEEAHVVLTGFAGFLVAPFAFYGARGLHRGAIQALGVVDAGAITLSPLSLAVLRALEYGCLGAVLGWIAVHRVPTIRAHAATGLATGVVFGTMFFALSRWINPTPLSVAVLLAFAVNEFLFPVGCALVLLAARLLGRHAIHVESGG